VFKSLELIFFQLSKIGDRDAFSAEAKLFAEKYAVELKEILLYGIEYDWDEDSTLGSEEIGIRPVRRLERG
jgi:hypothetical protein